MSKLESIVKDSGYSFAIFFDSEVKELDDRAFFDKDKLYVECLIRKENVILKPEEIVRQLYIQRLIKKYKYPKERISIEYSVTMGSKKRADIVILGEDRVGTPYIIIEVKQSLLTSGKNQLRSYCHATDASIFVWTNGDQISYYRRKDPNYFEDITDIPKSGQKIADILRDRFTLKDLMIKDKLANEHKSLKELVLEMEYEVLANAGVDVFEEVFKLIFTKLYDEFSSQDDKIIIEHHLNKVSHFNDVKNDRHEDIKKHLLELDGTRFRGMEFRNTGQTESQLKQKIQKLFNKAKKQWRGVFNENAVFELSDSHLSICVSSLQDVKLFNSNLLVIDEAFEYLVSKSAKGEKGQFFTPRHVIDMCVQMLNPKRNEYMIDTASGSSGFTVHTLLKLTGHLFANEKISKDDQKSARNVFGIDFDEKVVRVARILNLIAGEGETNIFHLHTLDFAHWKDKTENDKRWIQIYGDGFERLESLRAIEGDNHKFNFDILMATPPFAVNIKEHRILSQYQISSKSGKPRKEVGCDVLFIERNLDFLKPGGRMAMVLPQGRFNSISDKYIRDFISERARILAVVGLNGNTFKPHTGTKTSVLFVQKWDDKLCPKKENYPIFFAVSEQGGKDNSGNSIYVKNDDGTPKLDRNGHSIFKHDLHNNGGELPDGIAEEFIKFAKKEKLSFWKS